MIAHRALRLSASNPSLECIIYQALKSFRNQHALVSDVKNTLPPGKSQLLAHLSSHNPLVLPSLHPYEPIK